jgi:hypothetical protein
LPGQREETCVSTALAGVSPETKYYYVRMNIPSELVLSGPRDEIILHQYTSERPDKLIDTLVQLRNNLDSWINELVEISDGV